MTEVPAEAGMSADPDRAAVDACWAAFCAASGVQGEPSDVFAFGDSAAMADDLARLVVEGTKRATVTALVDCAAQGFVPAVGDHAVVVRGDGSPAAVVRATEVRTGPLSSVDEAFAWDEGEGERTRDWWVAGHRAFFRRWFATSGRPPDDDPELVFERFVLRWTC
jgi:uncharacterized protein YhfF